MFSFLFLSYHYALATAFSLVVTGSRKYFLFSFLISEAFFFIEATLFWPCLSKPQFLIWKTAWTAGCWVKMRWEMVMQETLTHCPLRTCPSLFLLISSFLTWKHSTSFKKTIAKAFNKALCYILITRLPFLAMFKKGNWEWEVITDQWFQADTWI